MELNSKTIRKVSPLKQFFTVYEYELKQAFFTPKAIITLSSIVLLTTTVIYWLQRLQSKFYDSMDSDERKISRIFNRIFSDTFYESYPFLEGVEPYIMFLHLCSLTVLPIFILILSYDITSNEIRDKTFRFFIFRSNILTFCFGKLAAYATQFAVLTATLWILALLYNRDNPNFNFSLDLSYIFHFWFIDQFLNVFVIAFSLFTSCSFKNPLLGNFLLLFTTTYLLMKIDYLNEMAYRIFYGMVSAPFSFELVFSLSCLTIMTAGYFTFSLIIMAKKEL